MECVILVGIQGSGKSTFYKDKFFATHVRINLDMLRSRQREDIFLAASLQAKQKFVVDNTNPKAQDRKKYIEYAKKFGFKVVGYFFEPDLPGALARNEARTGKERIPPPAIRRTLNRLEVPHFEEGFEELYHVRLDGDRFIVTEQPNKGNLQ